MVPSMPAPAPAATFVPGRMIGMRPGEKRPYALKADERNPYAKRSEQEEVSAEKNGNAEELRIREKLSRLRVTGRSQGGNGLHDPPPTRSARVSLRFGSIPPLAATRLYHENSHAAADITTMPERLTTK